MMLDSSKFEKKKFSMVLGSPTGAQWTVKNESRLSTDKSALFYSEFNADSKYLIRSEKSFGRKNGLIDTCPFNRTKKLQLTHIHIVGFKTSTVQCSKIGTGKK
jgi:hypothetical protein